MSINTNYLKPVWENVRVEPPLLRPNQVFKSTGLSKSVVYDLIAKGLFPPFIKIGPRASAMPRCWLDAFLQARADQALDCRKECQS